MTSERIRVCTVQRRADQHGAVLYVALIMLVLLAMLGIVGLQVAGMQERMSANYRAVNLAFQNTEALVRVTECGLEVLNDVARPGCTRVPPEDVDPRCDLPFDPAGWAAARQPSDGPAVSIRQIESCLDYEAAIEAGAAERPLPVYRITGYQTDTTEADGSSAAAIDTIFRL